VAETRSLRKPTPPRFRCVSRQDRWDSSRRPNASRPLRSPLIRFARIVQLLIDVRRWYSTVFGLRTTRPQSSFVVRPAPSSCAMWISCEVRAAVGLRRCDAPAHPSRPIRTRQGQPKGGRRDARTVRALDAGTGRAATRPVRAQTTRRCQPSSEAPRQKIRLLYGVGCAFSDNAFRSLAPY